MQVHVVLSLLLLAWPVLITAAPNPLDSQDGATLAPRDLPANSSSTLQSADQPQSADQAGNNTTEIRLKGSLRKTASPKQPTAGKEKKTKPPLAEEGAELLNQTGKFTKRPVVLSNILDQEDQYGKGFSEPSENYVLAKLSSGISLRSLDPPDSYSAIDEGEFIVYLENVLVD